MLSYINYIIILSYIHVFNNSYHNIIIHILSYIHVFNKKYSILVHKWKQSLFTNHLNYYGWFMEHCLYTGYYTKHFANVISFNPTSTIGAIVILAL